jgi:hypothetical protein
MTDSTNTTNLRGFPPVPGVFLNIEQEVTAMSNHSRRAVLAGIATAPALAAPALAMSGPGPDDPIGWVKEAQQRLEEMIDTLRTCVVCDGWHPNGLDEAAAARALAYFRAGFPEESAEDFAERKAMGDFVRSHGQSLDWIIEGDPGGLICRAAAHSRRAQSLALSGPDPIYAAIEEFKAAVVTRTAAMHAFNDADESPASAAVHHEAMDREFASLDKLIATSPTSVAGMAALLDTLGVDPYEEAEKDDPNYDPPDNTEPLIINALDRSPDLLTTLASTLRAIGGVS